MENPRRPLAATTAASSASISSASSCSVGSGGKHRPPPSAPTSPKRHGIAAVLHVPVVLPTKHAKISPVRQNQAQRQQQRSEFSSSFSLSTGSKTTSGGSAMSSSGMSAATFANEEEEDEGKQEYDDDEYDFMDSELVVDSNGKKKEDDNKKKPPPKMETPASTAAPANASATASSASAASLSPVPSSSSNTSSTRLSPKEILHNRAKMSLPKFHHPNQRKTPLLKSPPPPPFASSSSPKTTTSKATAQKTVDKQQQQYQAVDVDDLILQQRQQANSKKEEERTTENLTTQQRRNSLPDPPPSPPKWRPPRVVEEVVDVDELILLAISTHSKKPSLPSRTLLDPPGTTLPQVFVNGSVCMSSDSTIVMSEEDTEGAVKASEAEEGESSPDSHSTTTASGSDTKMPPLSRVDSTNRSTGTKSKSSHASSHSASGSGTSSGTGTGQSSKEERYDNFDQEVFSPKYQINENSDNFPDTDNVHNQDDSDDDDENDKQWHEASIIVMDPLPAMSPQAQSHSKRSLLSKGGGGGGGGHHLPSILEDKVDEEDTEDEVQQPVSVIQHPNHPSFPETSALTISCESATGSLPFFTMDHDIPSEQMSMLPQPPQHHHHHHHHRHELPRSTHSSSEEPKPSDTVKSIVLPPQDDKNTHHNVSKKSLLVPDSGMDCEDPIPLQPPIALDMDALLSDGDDEEKARKKKQSTNSLVCFGIVVVLGIVVLLAVFLSMRDSGSEEPASPPPSSSSAAAAGSSATPVPTSNTLSNPEEEEEEEDANSATDRLWTLLPTFTQATIKGHPGSPQFRAYEWMIWEDLVVDDAAAPLGDDRMLQRYAMATIYFATGGPHSWAQTYQWLNHSLHECDWNADDAAKTMANLPSSCVNQAAGGNDETSDAFITHLLLKQNQLMGTIPEEISLLSSLIVLNLEGNDELYGSLPTQLGQLSHLSWLQLSSNALSGTIPLELAALVPPTGVLTDLDLSNNAGMRGIVPEELCFLDNLRFTCSDTLCGCDCPCGELSIYQNSDSTAASGPTSTPTSAPFAGTTAGPTSGPTIAPTAVSTKAPTAGVTFDFIAGPTSDGSNSTTNSTSNNNDDDLDASSGTLNDDDAVIHGHRNNITNTYTSFIQNFLDPNATASEGWQQLSGKTP